MTSNLSDKPIQFLKGVGPARANVLANLGVHSIEDLLYLFPYRYEDRTKFTPIKLLSIGCWHTISGKVVVAGERKSWVSKKRVVEIVIADQSARIFCVWFNQPYLEKFFKVGQDVVMYGKVDIFNKRLQITSPEYEIVNADEQSLNMGRIVPVYPLTKGISQQYLRKIMDLCINTNSFHMKDIVPIAIRQRQKLLPIAECIKQIHFPDNIAQQVLANGRIAFEEFFLFQIAVILRRLSIVQKHGIAHTINDQLLPNFTKSLPFSLTNSQQSVIKDIVLDMSKDRPMLRLLQGDVGCGKTIIAFFACINAILSSHQAAIMAPTEILAHQHYLNFVKLFDKGLFKDLRVTVLSSNLPKKQKDQIYKDIKDGRIDLIIGTHAILQDAVLFKDLSLVVIDEQHKFGVQQRALLSAKSLGNNADVLIMTATPIPRTLCLTLYGDLDVSIINELPPGRGNIFTYHFAFQKAQGVYDKVRQWVKKGTQAYIIYPLVQESEKLDLKAATEMFEHFRQHEFNDLRIALVHGQMDRNEVEEIMLKFKNHELDILVATTILEVGIDVPNANVMVIEHAERFGLSQLHQLRGRIGRGKKDAVCVLLGDISTEDSKARLEAIVKTRDGFKIAQYDLEIRGPGHYFGRHQHGLNELKVANPITQLDILERARKEAIDLTILDPKFNQKDNIVIKSIIKKRYPQYLNMVLAG